MFLYYKKRFLRAKRLLGAEKGNYTICTYLYVIQHTNMFAHFGKLLYLCIKERKHY